MSPERFQSRTGLARLGFTELDQAERGLDELEELTGLPRATWISEASTAGDPDAAVRGLVAVARRDAIPVREVLSSASAHRAVWALLGASEGYASFYLRHPSELQDLLEPRGVLASADELRDEMLASVGAVDGFAEKNADGWIALRVCYR